MLEKPPFDIRERTFIFGVRVVKFVRTLPKDVASIELARQFLIMNSSELENLLDESLEITKILSKMLQNLGNSDD